MEFNHVLECNEQFADHLKDFFLFADGPNEEDGRCFPGHRRDEFFQLCHHEPEVVGRR